MEAGFMRSLAFFWAAMLLLSRSTRTAWVLRISPPTCRVLPVSFARGTLIWLILSESTALILVSAGEAYGSRASAREIRACWLTSSFISGAWAAGTVFSGTVFSAAVFSGTVLFRVSFLGETIINANTRAKNPAAAGAAIFRYLRVLICFSLRSFILLIRSLRICLRSSSISLSKSACISTRHSPFSASIKNLPAFIPSRPAHGLRKWKSIVISISQNSHLFNVFRKKSADGFVSEFYIQCRLKKPMMSGHLQPVTIGFP